MPLFRARCKTDDIRLGLIRDWNEELGCPEDSELDAFREGKLDDQARRDAIEKHVAQCPICRAYVKYGRSAQREQRGRAALRSLLNEIRRLLMIPWNWLFPRRSKPGPRVAHAGVLPPVALGLAALTTYGVGLGSHPPAPPQLPFPIRQSAQLQLSAADLRPPAVFVAAHRPFAAAAFVAAASDQIKGHVAEHRPHVEITLTRIGATPIAAGHAEEATAGVAPVPVHRFETLSVRLANPVPHGAHVYAAVRQNGGHWEVSDGIEAPARSGPLRIAGKFGSQDDDLALFDLRVLVHRENLPAGPAPDALLTNAGVLAISPIFRVQRVSLNRPVLAITHIDHAEVWDGGVPWVYNESGIQIYASKLPIGAKIGLVVKPTRPLNDSRWVQLDEIETSGIIDSYFGNPGYHSFVRFAAQSFAVASEKDFPPRGVPISSAEWPVYSAKFLSFSAPVSVVKAGDHFTIEELNSRSVPASGRAIAEPQTDIRGLLDRPIAPGERIWLLCAPRDGAAAWVAGATTDGVDNAWIAKAVQLWKRGQPSSFDLLAVLTSDDPNQIDPAQLRNWANLHKHAVNRVTLQIAEARAR